MTMLEGRHARSFRERAQNLRGLAYGLAMRADPVASDLERLFLLTQAQGFMQEAVKLEEQAARIEVRLAGSA